MIAIHSERAEISTGKASSLNAHKYSHARVSLRGRDQQCVILPLRVASPWEMNQDDDRVCLPDWVVDLWTPSDDIEAEFSVDVQPLDGGDEQISPTDATQQVTVEIMDRRENIGYRYGEPECQNITIPDGTLLQVGCLLVSPVLLRVLDVSIDGKPATDIVRLRSGYVLKIERRVDIDLTSDAILDLRDLIDISLWRNSSKLIGNQAPKCILVAGPGGVGKSTQIMNAVGLSTVQNLYIVSLNDVIHEYQMIEADGSSLDTDFKCILRKALDAARDGGHNAVIIEDLDTLIYGCYVEDVGAIARRLSDLIVDALKDTLSSLCILASCRDVSKLPVLVKDLFTYHIQLQVPKLEERNNCAAVELRKLLKAIGANVEEDHFSTLAQMLAQSTPGATYRDMDRILKRFYQNLFARMRSTLAETTSDPEVDAIVELMSRIDLSPRNATAPVSTKTNKTDDPHRGSMADTSLLIECLSSAIKGVKLSLSDDIKFNMTKPEVSWDMVSGYRKIKKRLMDLVKGPLEHSETFKRLGVKPPAGILLYGPSGCGKTFMVHALASTLPLNYISLKGSDLYSKYLGESESTIRKVFATARRFAPCLVFFDEIDSVAMRRDWDNDGGSGVNERVLSTLLNELDGVESLTDVIVIACTNRPDRLDDALLRPGRLDNHLFVGLPSSEDRRDMLTALLLDWEDKEIERVCRATEGFTGADLLVLLREAAILAIRDRGIGIMSGLEGAPPLDELGDGRMSGISWVHVSAALAGAIRGPTETCFAGVTTGRKSAMSRHPPGTWGVATDSSDEEKEVLGLLGTRDSASGVDGGSVGWWRPSAPGDEEMATFIRFKNRR